MLTDAQKRFIRRHFSYIVRPFFSLLVTIMSFPYMFQHDSKEYLVEIKGIINNIDVKRGETDAENVFEIRLKEQAPTFVATHMQSVDQMLLFKDAQNKSPITVFVEQEKLDAAEPRLDVLGLNTE